MIRRQTVWELLHYGFDYGLAVSCLEKDYPEHIAEMILAYKRDLIDESELEACLMEAGWILDKSKEKEK